MTIIRCSFIKYFLAFNLFFIGCTPVNSDRVSEDFQKLYPDSHVVSISATEGDFDTVYMRIAYKKHELKGLKETFFMYQRNLSSGTWMFLGQVNCKEGSC